MRQGHKKRLWLSTGKKYCSVDLFSEQVTHRVIYNTVTFLAATHMLHHRCHRWYCCFRPVVWAPMLVSRDWQPSGSWLEILKLPPHCSPLPLHSTTQWQSREKALVNIGGSAPDVWALVKTNTNKMYHSALQYRRMLHECGWCIFTSLKHEWRYLPHKYNSCITQKLVNQTLI